MCVYHHLIKTHFIVASHGSIRLSLAGIMFPYAWMKTVLIQKLECLILYRNYNSGLDLAVNLLLSQLTSALG